MVSWLFAFDADKSYKLRPWWLATAQQPHKAATVSKMNVTVYNVKSFVDKNHSIS